jgi:hypothetical protein
MWTPKQHIEHQQLLERMEREQKQEAVAVPRKKKKAKKRPAKR